MEYRNAPRELADELETYQALAGEVGIPRVYWYGNEGLYYVLVLELLGPSLVDLLNYCDRRFSLKSILLIADQAISRMERIHRRFLHRDIKPSNIIITSPNDIKQCTAALIDFDFSFLDGRHPLYWLHDPPCLPPYMSPRLVEASGE